MELIKQRSDNDCGVACAAMIAGTTYEEAYETFSEKLGYAHTGSINNFLKKHGLACYRSDQKEDADTVCYLMHCCKPAGGHFCVMDIDGTIYDPSPTPLKEYHWVNFIEVREVKTDN